MSSFDKYRVHEVAKDFNLPSKLIAEVLTKYATAPKNHMQVLDDAELSVIFEYLTQANQCATMEELFTLPDKNRGEWAAQQAALLRCLTPDAPYPEADRRSVLAACRGLWEVRVREGFLLLSQAAAELPGDSGEPLLALLSDGVSWRAYAYQTNLDAEGYARGLAACRQEQGALWSELAGLGLLEQEELP